MWTSIAEPKSKDKGTKYKVTKDKVQGTKYKGQSTRDEGLNTKTLYITKKNPRLWNRHF